MASYTIHLPPGDNVADTERFRTIRDGLSPWAMIFWPVWFLVKRLWLGAVLVYALWAMLNLGLYSLGIAPPAIALSWAVFLLLIGLEAHSLERWTLARRGWREVGVAVAGNAQEAEERAVMALADADWVAPPADLPRQWFWQTRAAPRRAPAADVLGLFPEPNR